MSHSPPPFFKRGPAPIARLVIFSAIAIALMIVDTRLSVLDPARQAAALVTWPLQRLMLLPGEGLEAAGAYLSGVDKLESDNDRMRREHLENASTLLRAQQIEAENASLRALLDMRERQPVKGRVAQILYTARDPFSRRVVIDKGEQHEIHAGELVVDEQGVVGQVTRSYPFMSEITLVTDKGQALPVQIMRNGLRAVTFGAGHGRMEIRHMPFDADVKSGDILVTSGLDGHFLAGLPVARVTAVDRGQGEAFAHIRAEPVAGVELHTYVLVLANRDAVPPRPELAPETLQRRAH